MWFEGLRMIDAVDDDLLLTRMVEKEDSEVVVVGDAILLDLVSTQGAKGDEEAEDRPSLHQTHFCCKIDKKKTLKPGMLVTISILAYRSHVYYIGLVKLLPIFHLF